MGTHSVRIKSSSDMSSALGMAAEATFLGRVPAAMPSCTARRSILTAPHSRARRLCGSPAAATDGGQSNASEPVWLGPPRGIGRQHKATMSCCVLGGRQPPSGEGSVWRRAAADHRLTARHTERAPATVRIHKPAVEIPDPFPPRSKPNALVNGVPVLADSSRWVASRKRGLASPRWDGVRRPPSF
jgi:hypothetical protein